VFPVRYELSFYISEDDTLHNHRSENIRILHSTNRLGFIAEKYCVSCEVLTKFNISEEGIRHNRRRENVNSYIALTGWSL
jgi:hypothetical protein